MQRLGSVQPLQVSVCDLSISIDLPTSLLSQLKRSKPQKLSVLSKVSLDMQPGQVIAIMGSSGSGKTTLLNALAGRTLDTEHAGKIKFNGVSPKRFYASHNVAYVQQHDHIMPYLTVRETLEYTAELRLDARLSRLEKSALVEEVILELGLKVSSGGQLIL